MTDDQTTTTSTTDEPTSSGSPVPQVDPAEYNQYKDYYERTAPFLQKLAPHADLVTELAENDELRNLYTNTKESYTHLKQQNRKPEDIMLEKLSKVEEKLTSWEKVQQEQTNRSNQAALAKAQEVISRQKASHPELNSPEGNDLFMTVANYAGRNGLDYGEAWKEYTSKLGLYPEQLPVEKPTPPRSLRSGGQTQPGVPTEGKPRVTNNKELGGYLRSTFRKAANR